MAITIKSPNNERAAQKLDVFAAMQDEQGLKTELLAIGAHCASLPDINARSPDNILGYDERGLPA